MQVTFSDEMAMLGSPSVEVGCVAFSSFVGRAVRSCPIRLIEIDMRYESRCSISMTLSTTCLRSAT